MAEFPGLYAGATANQRGLVLRLVGRWRTSFTIGRPEIRPPRVIVVAHRPLPLVEVAVDYDLGLNDQQL